MADRLRGERLQIMLSPEELELIDDFRFAKRMPSRAATVRELFRRGLAAEGILACTCGPAVEGFRCRRQAGAIEAIAAEQSSCRLKPRIAGDASALIARQTAR